MGMKLVKGTPEVSDNEAWVCANPVTLAQLQISPSRDIFQGELYKPSAVRYICLFHLAGIWGLLANKELL